jgi:hypothetical protein
MKKLVVAVGFLVAVTSTAFALRHARSDVYYGFGPDVRAHIIKVNAPGGAYIQCDGPNAPIRCTPDGWSIELELAQ